MVYNDPSAPSSKEKLPKQEQSPEQLSQDLKKLEAKLLKEKMEAKKQTHTMLPDIERKALEDRVLGPDKETAMEMISIEKLTDEVEVNRRIESFKNVTATLLAKFNKHGIKAEAYATLEGFKETLRQVSTAPRYKDLWQELNRNEQIALNKFESIINNPLSLAYKTLNKEWTNFLTEINSLIEDAKIGVKAMEAEIRGEKPEQSTISKAYSYIKKRPWLAVIGIAIASYGIYKFINRKKASDSSLSKKGKLAKYGLPSLLGLGVLAALAGPSALKWLEKNSDALANSKEAWEKLKEGKLGEALLLFFQGPEKNVAKYRNVAQAISKDLNKKIETKVVKSIANAPYQEFMSFKGQATSFAFEMMKKLMPSRSVEMGALATGTSANQGPQETLIRNYLHKHKATIAKLSLPPNPTVFQVLEKLITAEKEPIAPEAAPTAIEGLLVANGDSEVKKEALQEVKTSFENMKNFQAFLNKYEGKWSKAIWSPTVFAEDLYNACKMDGIPVLASTAGILLWNGYKWVALTSVEAISEAFIALAQAPFNSDVGILDAPLAYADKTWPFAVIVGGSSALLAKLKGKSAIKAAFTGAGKGFLVPVKLASLHVSAAKGTAHLAKVGKMKVDIIRASGAEKLKATQRQTTFYAELARHYEELRMKAEGTKKTNIINKFARKLSKENIEALEEKYSKAFVQSYNEELKIRGSKEVPLDPATDARGTRTKMHEVLVKRRGLSFLSAQKIFYHEKTGKVLTNETLSKKAAALRAAIKEQDLSPQSQPSQQLRAIEAYLAPEKMSKFSIRPESLQGLKPAEKAKEIEKISLELRARENGIQVRFDAEVDNIVNEAKRKKLAFTSPEVTGKLKALDEKYLVPFAKQKQKTLQTLFAQYEKLPKAHRTLKLKRHLHLTIQGAQESKLTRIVRAGKGRLKIAVLIAGAMFAVEAVTNPEVDRDFDKLMKDLGPEGLQILLEIMPVTGWLTNYYAALSGEEFVTEKKVEGFWARYGKMLWGNVDFAADMIALIGFLPSGGTSAAAGAAVKVGKAGIKAEKVIAMMPRINKIIKKKGGIVPFIDAIKQAKSATKTFNYAVAGASGAMLIGGVSAGLYYTFVDEKTEIKIPPDLVENTPPKS